MPADLQKPDVRRPPELQDWLNSRLYHPLSMRMAMALEHTPLTPNMVSAAGFLCLVLVAIFYGSQAGIAATIAGLSLHMTWHILDGADGDLARLTGRESALGELIDGLSDYGGHIVLYLTLGWVLSAQIGAWGWALMLAAGGARIVQANFFESVRRHYQWRVYGQEWIAVTHKESGGVVGLIASAYIGLGRGYLARAAALDGQLRLADDKQSAVIIAAIKREYGAILGPLNVLGANYRTLALGLSMLARSPAYFFALELVVLSIAMLALRIRVNRAEDRLAAQF